MRGTLLGGGSGDVPIELIDDELADECEAFLSGGWDRWQWGGGGSVHRDDVGTLVARALLAAEPEAVIEAQRNVRIPLELELMGAVVSPCRVVELAATALVS